jgi:hypothetical protein
MQIEDGAGSGTKAQVNIENRLAVTAISSSVEHHTNHHDGAAYHVLWSQVATAGDDCIFYMSNDAEEDITCEGISISVSGAAEIYIQSGDTGARNTATDLTPANCNFGSGRTAEGTFEQGADLDGGAATLAGGTEVERYVFRGQTNTAHINFPQDFIMPKGSTLTVWSSTTATVVCTLYFNYHNVSLG